MLITDERTLADIACIEPVYVDGVLGVLNLGDNFLTCYYRHQVARCGEDGAAIIERRPSLVLVRPLTSLPKGSLFAKWISAQDGPVIERSLLALAH